MQVEAWVVRFMRFCGLSRLGWDVDTQLHLTTETHGWNGKGKASVGLELTHMIDNECDCLWSVLADPHGNCGETMQVICVCNLD